MAPIIERIHDRIIGNTDQQVVLTGVELVPIVRDERAVDAPDLTLPIDTIGVLRNFKNVLGWLALVAGAIFTIPAFLIVPKGGKALWPDFSAINYLQGTLLLLIGGAVVILQALHLEQVRLGFDKAGVVVVPLAPAATVRVIASSLAVTATVSSEPVVPLSVIVVGSLLVFASSVPSTVTG